MKVFSILFVIALVTLTGFEIYKLVRDIIDKRKNNKKESEK